MVSAGEFRKGVTFEMDGNIFTIIDFQHVKPGKGAAFVRTKIKNIKSGAVVERSFNPTDKFEKAHIERKTMQYLYEDNGLYFFMDNESYEQIPLNHSQVEDAIMYLKPNDNAFIQFHKGEAFSVEPDNFVVMEITFCEPGVKGDTATGATKPATLETGAVVQVPLFVNQGDKIRVDTRTGTYMERA